MSDLDHAMTKGELAVDPTSDASPREDVRLRLWPAIAAVMFQLAMIIGVCLVSDNGMFIFLGKLIGPALGTLVFAIWWLFFSRAPTSEH